MKRIVLPALVTLFSMNLANFSRAASDAESKSAAEQREFRPIHDKSSMEQKSKVLNTDMQEATLPAMTVYKSPTCGCCTLWAEHMEKADFTVTVRNVPQMSPIKEQFSVPTALSSCHTATVGGYFVEGHVPASDVKRLLKERPEALGIGVPGMPMGSPGMEVPSGETQPYMVTQVNKNGSLVTFSAH